MLCKSVQPDTERALREMFSENECIERRELTVLQKIVLGLITKDLEAELTASTADINSTNSDGRTALTLAAECGDLNSINLLLRFGADPAVRSVSGGHTALHYAAYAPLP